MFVIYNTDTSYVLNIVDSVKIAGDYIIIEKDNIKVRYLNNNVSAVPISQEQITFKDGVPLVYDVEHGLVYPDPFYEEETPDDGSGDDSDDSGEEKPMTVAEMRTKITELEEQLAATKILLGVE